MFGQHSGNPQADILVSKPNILGFQPNTPGFPECWANILGSQPTFWVSSLILWVSQNVWLTFWVPSQTLWVPSLEILGAAPAGQPGAAKHSWIVS